MSHAASEGERQPAQPIAQPIAQSGTQPAQPVAQRVAQSVARVEPFPEETLAELQEIVARYPQPRSALLPMLHLVQSVEGRVTSRGIEVCAEILGMSAAEVAGVATFYTMYKRRPVGDYHVGVCTNTLCAVMGGDAIFERLKDHLGVGNDETTPDDGTGRTITLEHVECNAACDYAPVVMVNWEFLDNMTPQSATALVDDLRAGREVHASRGARLCTWREAERVLAGFPDGRADEGPAAGPASLLGLRIARANGWKAPSVQRAAVTAAAPSSESGGDVADSVADTALDDSETRLDDSPTEVKTGPADMQDEGPGHKTSGHTTNGTTTNGAGANGNQGDRT